jgi:superfamily I DNA/RNA helicase
MSLLYKTQEVIPHIMSEGDEDKEEERRLLYVGRPPARPSPPLSY